MRDFSNLFGFDGILNTTGSVNYIKLGPDIIEYAGEFRLYLRSATPVDDERLQLCVTTVDLTLEWAGIVDYFTSALV